MKCDKFNQPYYDHKTAILLINQKLEIVTEYVLQCSEIRIKLIDEIHLNQDLQKEINILQNENTFLKELIDDPTRSIE